MLKGQQTLDKFVLHFAITPIRKWVKRALIEEAAQVLVVDVFIRRLPGVYDGGVPESVKEGEEQQTENW